MKKLLRGDGSSRGSCKRARPEERLITGVCPPDFARKAARPPVESEARTKPAISTAKSYYQQDVGVFTRGVGPMRACPPATTN